MKLKAFARYIYANVPGAAAARFTAKDPRGGISEQAGIRRRRMAQYWQGALSSMLANRGQSIAAFRKAVPDAHIIAFEPEPRSAKRLILQYQGDSTVEINACALGANAGVITFFVPTYGHWDRDGMSATTYETATEWLTDPGRMYLYDRTKLSVQECPVACKTS